MKLYTSDSTQALPFAHDSYFFKTSSFQVDIKPLDKMKYHAEAEITNLGVLTLAKTRTNAAIVNRRRDFISAGNQGRYCLVFVLDGSIVISHQLGSSELQAGHFMLMDNIHPRIMYVYQEVCLVTVNIPERNLQAIIPCPQEVVGLKMTDTNLDGTSLSEWINTTWEQVKKGLIDEFSPGITESFTDRLGRIYSASCLDKNSRFVRRVIEVKLAIEENLGNPELTVEMLAATLRVSSRYLRSLFSQRERLSHYILRRRLEECANQLANPLYQGVSITTIAFQWGFNCPEHFSRAFKKRYGCSPREYRKRHGAYLTGG
ncbi:MAG: helix-turn-helix domain-containing protein [Pseudomonadales bacterium]|nr:helix-turn-helix domain-containing protein [Pseudomonadales bacterium]